MVTSTPTAPITVYIDNRWPLHLSVGTIQELYIQRRPPNINVVDLEILGRIGSPVAPLNADRALSRTGKSAGSVFLNIGLFPPSRKSPPTVLVVHDLTHRETYGPLKRLHYDLVLRPLFRRCTAIVCVSDYTRNQFLAWSGMDPDRVFTIHNGGPQNIRAEGRTHDPGYPYLFYCGNHRRHKNLSRMVEAFCRSRLPDLGYRYVLTNGENPELRAIAERFGKADSLVFAGFLDEEGLHAHYRGATALAYASLFEGFGLPILEAFATATPVLTANTTATAEVAADAALTVDPRSVEEITQGMERIVEDEELRQALIARGRERLKDFDWDRSAEKLWQIVSDVAEQGKSYRGKRG